MSIKGYKVFNPDWTCRGMKYEVGKAYKYDGLVRICKAGFHFCKKVADCFNYYSFDPENKVAEVEATGLVESDGTKCVTNEIKILREISWSEMLELANEGKGNAGIHNSGNNNSGNYNSGNNNNGTLNTGNNNNGNLNTGNNNNGNLNTGNRNTGNRNTGDANDGHWNTGDANDGLWNTGSFNTGDYNSGHWNSGNGNTGFFSRLTPKVDLFEKPSEFTHEQALNIPGIYVLNRSYRNNWWIDSKDMTDEEKGAHPGYETTGGYLKSIPFKDACDLMWKNLSDCDKRKVLEIPNFDADIFYRITGIKVGGQSDD